MANLDIIRGRQVVIPLMNRTGGAVINGDVVVLDTANDDSFVTTTTVGDTRTVGVVQESIADLGVGRVLIAGYCPLVNVNAAVTRGHYLQTHSVAKQGQGVATRGAGAMGQFSVGGGTPKAVLWGAPSASGLTGPTGAPGAPGAAGVSLTIEEVDGAPTGVPTKLVLPNGTLAIAAGVATYTPAAAGASLTIEEVDGSPTGVPTKLVFPNGTLGIAAGVATYTPAAGGGGGGSVAGFIGACVYHSTTQVVGSSPFLFLFDSELWDTDGFHDTVTNNTRLTIPAGMGGKYLAITRPVKNTVGHQDYYILKNGVNFAYGAMSYSGHMSVILDLVPGDYIEMGSGSNGTYGSTGATDKNMLQIVKLDSGKVGAGIGAKAYNSAAQTGLGNGVYNILTHNSEDFDTDGFHSTSTLTGRMTIPPGLGGKYLVIGATGYVTSVSHVPYLFVNGVVATGDVWVQADRGGQVSGIFNLVPGDYVELRELHNTGTQSAGGATADLRASLSIMRLDSEASSAVGTAHSARVKRASGNVSLGTNTLTPIPFTAEDHDTDTMHDNSTNPSRVIIPSISGVTTGLWAIKASGYTDVAAGRCDAMLRKNAAGNPASGTVLAFTTVWPSASLAGFHISTDAVFSAGDYVELFVRSINAGYNVIYDADISPIMTVSFLGKMT